MLALLFALTLSRSRSHHLMANAQTGRVNTASGLNIRSGPGTNYAKLTAAPNGATMTILGGPTNGFYKVSYKGIVGYASKDYLVISGSSSGYPFTGYVTADVGLRMRSSASTSSSILLTMPYGAAVTVNGDGGNNFYKVSYGGKSGYASKDYISKTKPGGGGSSGGGSSGTVIRQGDSRFNSNIRKWGCAFMSCCWCGGVNSISGCNSLYQKAVNNGWMRSDCYILSWDAMKNVAKARTYRYGGKNAAANSNEKEVLECHYGNGGMHFVVGNKRGGVEYDPAAPGFVSYSQHTSKRFFGY